MSRISHYISVYREFINTCISQAMTYRTHFALLIIMDLIFYLVTISTVHFLYDHISLLGHWDRSTFLFFISFVLVLDQLHMTFIAESFWMFSFDIRKGLLDFILIKPIGTLFIIFFRYFRPATFLNIIVTGALLIYHARQTQLAFWGWFVLPFLILLSFTLFVSLEILISMSMFWVIESFGINFIRIQFQNLARWPDFVYHYWMRKLLTFLFPVLLLGSAPIYFLKNPNDWGLLALQIFTLPIIWKLIHLFWKLGLKKYDSAA